SFSTTKNTFINKEQEFSSKKPRVKLSYNLITTKHLATQLVVSNLKD
ncbi:32412_t:CDS:1, partial [Racocetra persica]